MTPMLFNHLKISTLFLPTLFAISSCVSGSQGVDDNSSEVIGVTPIKPAQIGEDECVNYVQLERNAAYQCELANGETRAMREGERRNTALSKEEIIEVIDKNSETTDECIAEVERKDPKAKGKIVINFEVEPDGKITSAEIVSEKSSFKNDTAAQCLVGKIKNWRFPVLHNDDALEIKFPFEFGEDAALKEIQSAPAGEPADQEQQNTSNNGQSNDPKEIPNKKTIKKTRKM
jgi:hypothetical protein